MKKLFFHRQVRLWRTFLFGFIVLFGLFSIPKAQDFVPGQIMIDIKHEYLPITPTPNGDSIIVTGLPSIDSLNVLYGVYAFETPVNDSTGVSRGFFLFKFPDSLNVNQVLSSYLEDIHINMGSLNYIRKPHGITPSDYYYPQQWGLRKMQCPDAWRYSLGSSSIIIQIIDGGTDYGHPDLVDNIWQNTTGEWCPYGEDADQDGHTIEWDPVQNRWVLDPGDLNDVDEDYNGYRDDLVGWDFLSWDRDPDCEDSPYPWLDHGDQTAGTAAAVTDNYINPAEADWICYHLCADTSVAGTSWFSKIMIARFLGDDWDAMDAIDYAMNEGAKIINMSWGDTSDNPQLHAKLDEAWETGLLLIASAGNSYGEDIHYPAAYENVIAVAATDSDDVKTDYSTYGTWVDICAPGWNKTPDRDNKFWQYYCYANFGGTSCSAPFLSGVAALVWTCYPESSNTAIRTALINSADDIYDIPENYPYIGKLGSGRANAYNAVRYYGAEPRPSGDCNGDGVVDVADVVFLMNYLFAGGPPPNPLCIADVNDDGAVSVADIVY
ncbi:MAG: S8 family serine peptidase, partial [candidate division Zixibacteria bacterium]|nr:S8 family serine peptidase [candidate division Zixibacteria bacterium]